MDRVKEYLPLVARICMAQVFLSSALLKISGWSGGVLALDAAGIPAPAVFLGLLTLCELAGGLSILLGFKAKTGSLVLIVMLTVLSFMFNHFWTIDFDSQVKIFQRIMFTKNFAIVGGLIYIYIHGSGNLSLDDKLAAKS